MSSVFSRIRLRPRMLRGITEVDMSTTVLGDKISMPICVAPTGFHRLAHPDGEKSTARACTRSDTCMVLSMGVGFPLEDIAAASQSGPRWLNLYILHNKQWMKTLILKAEKLGFHALVVTVDATVMGNRRSVIRNRGFKPQFGLPMPLITGQKDVVSSFAHHNEFDKTITWDIISWVKSITKLPVIIKGILTAEDAKLAVQHGADAIIVSNHGGRQLDGVLATIDALPEVVSAVKGQVEVYLDGGVRLGTDVLKALALGARAVFIGRPVLWGLAYQGEEGVHKVLEILRTELKTAMILSGCSSVADISASLVTKLCQCHL
ncbi:Hydroxyacid oxidase 2 [Exaiptasia diaphana]|nr:Hydroxyacid oxidase 2 [Exaiptasia diaphana]